MGSDPGGSYVGRHDFRRWVSLVHKAIKVWRRIVRVATYAALRGAAGAAGSAVASAVIWWITQR
jgi:hypothetical protein